MKKKLLNILSIALLAALVVGCNGRGNNNNQEADNGSGGSSQGGGSSSEEALISDWPAALKTLMQSYCGEALPVLPMASAGFEYGEAENYYGTEYLEIYDNSSKNRIASYGSLLTEAGWSVGSDGDGGYLASKKTSDGLNAYDINYYFDSDYGNCLDCYHSAMTNEKTEGDDWTVEDKSLMVSALTAEIPFMKFGKGYQIQIQGDYLQFADNYYQDLTASYIEVLTSNGYTYKGLDEYGDPEYTKTLADQSVITLSPYYNNGNYIYGYYTPHETESATWPASVLTDIQNSSEYVVPEFEATSYSYYVKNGVVTISGSTSESLESDYLASAMDSGLSFVSPTSGVIQGWNEKISISYGDIGEYDDDYNLVITGFQIVVSETTPESDFSDTWPTDAVEEYLTGLNISVSVPATVDSEGHNFKYFELDYDTLLAQYSEEYLLDYSILIGMGFMTEEDVLEMAAEAAAENAGFYVTVYDKDGMACAQYEQTLLSTPWFVDEPDGIYGYAEDGEGECGVWYWNKGSITTVQIIAGSGDEHLPSLTLNKATAKVAPGGTLQLTATKSMIGEAVTWESSNTDVATVDNKGLVTVKDDALKDATATITASAGGKTAECVITVHDGGFTKVTSADDLTDGSYIIVCESKEVAFEGSVAADASGNKVTIDIQDDDIVYEEEVAAEAVTITAVEGGYTIQDGSGKYIGNDNDSNKLTVSSTALVNTITFDADGNADIVGAGGAHLRYNNSDSRFRYYKSSSYTGQTAIQLYKVG